MKFGALLLTIWIMLAAQIASAGAWTFCGTTTLGGSVKGGECVFFDPATGDVSSSILNVSLCENFDVLYEENMDVDTDGTTTCVVRNCVASTSSANHCTPIAGVTLTGRPPNEAIYGAAGQWVDAVCGSPGGASPRILLHCNP